MASFNRNQKRVAGPGFHVNVRYDDHAVARMKQMTNVADVLSRGARLAELYDVKEQELLVTMNSDKHTAYFDGMTHCFSACNGWANSGKFNSQQKKGGSGSDDLKEFILNQVSFVGVATTEYIPKPGYQEQGFVAQVGGVVTLMNESAHDIHPGQKVMLDVNTDYRRQVTREKGIPREKVRFTVAPAYTTDEIIEKAMKDVGGFDVDPNERQKERLEIKKLSDQLKTEKGKETRNEDRIKSLTNEIREKMKVCKSDGGGTLCNMRKVIRRINELNSRIIGKSYSYARKGDRLEVGLQPRNPY